MMLNIGSSTSILASASLAPPEVATDNSPQRDARRKRTGLRDNPSGGPCQWVLAHHHPDFEAKRAYAPVFAVDPQSGWIRDSELENSAFDHFIRTDRVRAIFIDGSKAEDECVGTLYRVRRDLLSRIPIFAVIDRPDPAKVARLLLAGADEVVVGQVNLELFEAKMASIARLDRLAFANSDVHRFGEYSFDSRRNIVSIGGSERAKLTPSQFKIALYFFRNVEKTVPFWKMIADLWEEPQPNIADSIRVHVCRIRQKLFLDGSYGYQLSRYNRGGYRLSVESDRTDQQKAA